MIEKLGGLIALVIGIFTFGFLKGKRDEKNKGNKNFVKRVRATKKRRDKRANDTAHDDLKWLQDNNSD